MENLTQLYKICIQCLMKYTNIENFVQWLKKQIIIYIFVHYIALFW